MEKRITKLRLLLWTFSGEDDYIIRTCNQEIQRKFAMIGTWVIVVIALCWTGTFNFFNKVFCDGNGVISLFISSVWCLMVLNLYLLILYTITPTLLPNKKSNWLKFMTIQGVKMETGAVVSLLGRLLFLALLALIMTQPLVIWLHENADPVFARPKGWTDGHMITNMEQISAMPSTWILSTLAVLMFWFPVYVKFTIRKDTHFYTWKQSIERSMVESDYMEFKVAYSRIMKEKIIEFELRSEERLRPYIEQLLKLKPDAKVQEPIMPVSEISFYEPYVDPPFNTEKRAFSINAGSEKDLLELLDKEY